MAEQLDPRNYHIEWVKKQMSIALKIDKENIIKRMKDKMWEYRKEIIAHDMAFFKNNHFSKYIKNDDNRPFMYSFLNMLKKKSETLSQEEIDKIWEETDNLLLYCIEYKRLIKDYDE
jgi:hypothetical protein